MFQFQDEIEIIMLVVSEPESAACDRDPVRESDYDVRDWDPEADPVVSYPTVKDRNILFVSILKLWIHPTMERTIAAVLNETISQSSASKLERFNTTVVEVAILTLVVVS
jgi:hypothetical protein